MADLAKIEEQLSSLTLMQAAELVKMLEEKWGVSAAAPITVASAGVAAPLAEAVTEKTEFEVVLTATGDKKVEVIKIVKDITGLGLIEAKKLVDEAPKSIKNNVKKAEAEEIKSKLEAAGAKVELK
ncbi:50S ribosomal protein L7/L12 [Rickettsia prowazekii]|uniref:Large ribosomal subunit protein bL12 n=2 Tax=Rickettsia prowazekii TaxID=782 RepID=RL7_RICPR|nr:50S ribosomal protein L7/L12 [Rickettsia prowazekii]Q9ZE21.1 RecName: Full=Large ribosomal subunit protein bL12; AltName: Full=50S ribosomal protein L7/L12 [Rickettsia prowazekii str. Madrid E]EOB10028.1 50S ribosomal protein L10 [Rickettsia prowazekii str. GvF12]ADE29648.1 50S ribosomal protein L7/L12 [Rickettsia prowazekii str. Rp22]AFE48962.1 50S ribosomal protein L7/L12 [Rickettsia prowazekii str. Chernikova]AFE49807.1 50S ribosomal protein L7/L12 [Rickettsia prowazekii str. Katsinyian]